MSEVTSTLIDVLANDYARQTLGAALQGVRFTPGPKPSVALDGGALVVQIAPARGRESFLTGGTLRAAIEDLF